MALGGRVRCKFESNLEVEFQSLNPLRDALAHARVRDQMTQRIGGPLSDTQGCDLSGIDLSEYIHESE